jgi:hypothetical protein
MGSGIQDPEKTCSGSRIKGSKRHRIPDPRSGSAALLATERNPNFKSSTLRAILIPRSRVDIMDFKKFPKILDIRLKSC